MPVSLAQALKIRRLSGRAGFVPFLVAGDPSYTRSLDAAVSLAEAGADILEVGVPFSDPVADGPVIQEAGQRALKNGMSLKRAISFVGDLRKKNVSIPVVLFTYLNPVLRLGLKRFAAAAANAGASAVLIVDLPAEESRKTEDELAKRGLELVLLASPTTTDERLRLIGRGAGTAVYYVSREGVTGERTGLAPNLAKRIEHVRRTTGKPLMVGFGVAEASQARALSKHADGVVVGSALVRANHSGGLAAARRLANKLVKALEI